MNEIKGTDQIISDHNEDNIDSKYFMLIDSLRRANRHSEADSIERIWKESEYSENIVLSADDCLAIKVKLVLTDNAYHTEYKWLNERGHCIFRPLNQLKGALLKYLPSHVKFDIKDDNAIVYSHDISTKSVIPLNFSDPFIDGHEETPNLSGSRYNVIEAIAKCLEETISLDIIPQIDILWDRVLEDHKHLGNPELDKVYEELGNLTFNATFKHGGDGMGDVNRWRDKSEVNLPDKGFHYSICLLSINVTINNKTYPIFNEPEPNSIHSNKNIMQAVADENNP